MAKITIRRNDAEMKYEFFGEYTDAEMGQMKLDEFDRAVLGQKTNAGSDMLLNLELLFRRMEEANG